MAFNEKLSGDHREIPAGKFIIVRIGWDAEKAAILGHDNKFFICEPKQSENSDDQVAVDELPDDRAVESILRTSEFAIREVEAPLKGRDEADLADAPKPPLGNKGQYGGQGLFDSEQALLEYMRRTMLSRKIEFYDIRANDEEYSEELRDEFTKLHDLYQRAFSKIK